MALKFGTMIKYLFSYKNAHKHFIDIDLKVKTRGEKSLSFQLPAWRPGRYELADFAKNIQNWNAFDENGNEINSFEVGIIPGDFAIWKSEY